MFKTLFGRSKVTSGSNSIEFVRAEEDGNLILKVAIGSTVIGKIERGKGYSYFHFFPNRELGFGKLTNEGKMLTNEIDGSKQLVREYLKDMVKIAEVLKPAY